MNRRQKRKQFKKALNNMLPSNMTIDLSGLFWGACKTTRKGMVFTHTFTMRQESGAYSAESPWLKESA